MCSTTWCSMMWSTDEDTFISTHAKTRFLLVMHRMYIYIYTFPPSQVGPGRGGYHIYIYCITSLFMKYYEIKNGLPSNLSMHPAC